ncbi:MAG: RNA polymerase sigma factor [Planctomycetales bacterium]|nr:RNA polymerase sigma factor [Planctomycetales bacterium]
MLGLRASTSCPTRGVLGVSASDFRGGDIDVRVGGKGGGVDIRQLVLDHHEVLYRYAYRLTGSVHDAEDLVQQTFAIAQQKIDSIRDDRKSRSWLCTTLRRRYLKLMRKRVAVPASNVELDVDLVPHHVPAEDQGFDGERLQEALDALSEPFRVVVLLFYFEYRSYQEIAAELELPIGTVMSRLSRAKRQLRGILSRQGIGESGEGGTAIRNDATASSVAEARNGGNG